MNSFRQIIHSAYTFIRSIEANKAASAITLDHLIDDKIKSLQAGSVTPIIDSKGDSVGSRISRADQLNNLEQSLNAVVMAISTAGNDPDKLAELSIDSSTG